MFLSLLAFSLVSVQGHVLVVDDGPNEYGAGWVFDLLGDGTIDSLAGLPTPEFVSDKDDYGWALAPLGDLNGDGTPDLAVAAPSDNVAGADSGCVWLLFRAPDGSLASVRSVRPHRSFAAESLSEPPSLLNVSLGANFGRALASLGDIAGDGHVALAVGSRSDDRAGNVWLLSLAADGSVARHQVFGEGLGGFPGDLDVNDDFGSGLATVGDLDGNGVPDLAVGAPGDDDGSIDAGALWLLFLAADGHVTSATKISQTSGGFTGTLHQSGYFGSSVCALGDLDGNGVPDLAVGAPGDHDGFTGSNGFGAVYILFMNADGSVLAHQKLSQIEGGLGSLTDQSFGASVAPIGDRNGDGVPDLAVGANDSSSTTLTGAVLVLFLNADGTVQSTQRHTSAFGVVGGDRLGTGLANVGDWDGDGRPDLVVGAVKHDGSVPPPDFATITAAVAAAANGDTILVRGGFYQGDIAISGRSLTIQAANPLNVFSQGQVIVSGLPASRSVRLGGLVIQAGFNQVHTFLHLENDAGPIWIDDCIVTGPSFSSTDACVGVANCSAVVLNRSEFYGNWPNVLCAPFLPAPAALNVSGGSSVYAYDCTFKGGSSSRFCGNQTCSYGGPGLVTQAADDLLYLSDCTVLGGDEHSDGTCCLEGGDALEGVGAVTALGSAFVGGQGCPNGIPNDGAVQRLSGASLRMDVDDPREGATTVFTLRGPPNAPVYLAFAFVSGPRLSLPQNGAELLGNPRLVTYLGRLGPDGRLVSGQMLGDVPPGHDVLHVYAQAYGLVSGLPGGATKTTLLAAPRRVQLGSGCALTLLAPGF